MYRTVSRQLGLVCALSLAVSAGGCAGFPVLDEVSLSGLNPWGPEVVVAQSAHTPGMPAWGEPMVVAAAAYEEDEPGGPYLLDSGDRLRIFVYAQPNLSRIYIVDQEGRIAVPLIGDVAVRGRTTRQVTRIITQKLGSQFVKDPQVTVDIAQNRPFFILGEVRAAGQYPFVSGMTVQSAVAIAGGYGDRANERKVQITRRHNGIVEKMDVPPDYIVRPGDEIYVYERWF